MTKKDKHELSSISDIQQALKDEDILKHPSDLSRYGNIRVAEKDNLILLNYTHEAHFENRWNFLERVSRGLILNKNTGEVIARPFDKFWNWGERGRYGKGHIVTVTEKLDGSLGILFRHKGKFRIATRGSFDSEQALWATEYFNNYLNHHVPDNLTLLFEIIYPDNRIVVDYGDSEELVLLAARDRYTGKYLPYWKLSNYAWAENMEIVHTWNFDSIDQIIQQLSSLDYNSEGWVTEMSDGSRWKFKGDQYMEMHKLISKLSFKRAAEAIKNNNLDKVLDVIPDEFLAEFNQWVNEIIYRKSELDFQIAEAFSMAPKISRKEFALWVQKHHPDLASYLFKRYDEKDYSDLIFKKEFGV